MSGRLLPEELQKLTDRERPSAQAKWFKAHYGVTLAYDRGGVILTKAAFEGLVAKQCGLAQAANQVIKPAVKLLRKAA